MYKLSRLLVALDLTEMDETLIKYTAHFAEKVKAETVYFLHVADSFDLPEGVRENFPDVMAPKDETIEALMQDSIEKFWENDYACDRKIEIKEGNPSEQLLKWVDIKDIDLVLMGRKMDLKGSGVMPQKIANVIYSSVLLIPEYYTFRLKKVVIPVDFSKHSSLALEQGIALAEESGPSLQLVNVYTVPSGYHKTGKTRVEFAEIMAKHAANDFQKFLKKNNVKESLPCEFRYDDDHMPADVIFSYAEEHDADLIIIGSKGRTGMASILLGSVTEKVIKYDSRIPLLVVKQKGENLGFFKALLKI